MNPSKALGLGLAAVLCWSTVATAFKIALSHQSVLDLIFIATASSSIVLGAILSFQGKFVGALASLKTDWKKALVFGALNPLLYYAVLLNAYNLLPAQIAQPINYTWAIMLAFLSVPFLGHKLSKLDIIALFICYSGVVVISMGATTGAQSTTMVGVALALLSTVIWAGYWIANSKDQREPISALFQNFILATPLAFLLAWWFNPKLTFSLPAILSGAYIGAFEMGIAFVFWLYAMKLTDNTSRISNLIFLAPFISLALIHFVLGESIHQLTYVGLSLIIVGLVLQSRGKASSK